MAYTDSKDLERQHAEVIWGPRIEVRAGRRFRAAGRGAFPVQQSRITIGIDINTTGLNIWPM